MQQSSQAGFTLIELMIVVAIVAILSAIGIPAYKDYTIRAKSTEMLSLAQNAKLAVSEALMNGMPVANISNDNLGLSPVRSTIVSDITVAGSIITITADHDGLGLPAANGAYSIVFTPTVTDHGVVSWACTVPVDAYRKYAPPICHN